MAALDIVLAAAVGAGGAVASQLVSALGASRREQRADERERHGRLASWRQAPYLELMEWADAAVAAARAGEEPPSVSMPLYRQVELVASDSVWFAFEKLTAALQLAASERGQAPDEDPGNLFLTPWKRTLARAVDAVFDLRDAARRDLVEGADYRLPRGRR